MPIFFVLLWRLIYIDINNNFESFFSLFLILVTLGMMLVGMQFLGSRIGHKAAWGSVTLVIAVMLFGYTFRASWIANFQSKDVPRELLVYTQTSQDIHQVAREIERAADLTGDGAEISLAIDTTDSYAWPWHWYLRNYTNVGYTSLDAEGAIPKDGAQVAVIHSKHNDKFLPDLVEGYSTPRRIQHRAWFPEDYRGMTPRVFWDTIWDPKRWRESVDFFIYRRLSGEIGSVDSYVYFSDDLPLSPLN